MGQPSGKVSPAGEGDEDIFVSSFFEKNQAEDPKKGMTSRRLKVQGLALSAKKRKRRGEIRSCLRVSPADHIHCKLGFEMNFSDHAINTMSERP